eukprot:3272520-Pyramimonas_sp.AAC.1
MPDRNVGVAVLGGTAPRTSTKTTQLPQLTETRPFLQHFPNTVNSGQLGLRTGRQDGHPIQRSLSSSVGNSFSFWCPLTVTKERKHPGLNLAAPLQLCAWTLAPGKAQEKEAGAFNTVA